ncbi:MAG TPA: hypothetical protein V6D08_08900 [Candidatus Obscuribacterales bacterium]
MRSKSGHTVIELGAIASCLTVLVLLCVNLAIVLTGASVNDRACRDAARAAAQASNSSDALRLARRAAASYKVDGYFLTQPEVSATEFVYEDFAGNPPPNTSPYVSVTTKSAVRMPTPVFFYGAQFKGGTMDLERTYTFPIVKTSLNL